MNYSIISTILKRTASTSAIALLFMILIEVPIVITYMVTRYITLFIITGLIYLLWELAKVLIKKAKSNA